VKISLLYTTARPNLITEVIKRWHDSAENSGNFEWIIVTDDPVVLTPSGDLRFIVNTGKRDCVTGWNLAAANAQGDIFVQVSDDLFPPSGWDRSIIREISRLKQKRPDVVLNLLDDQKITHAVFHPVLTRSCYEKLGYLYPPDFESMYCDNWFCAYHRKYSLYAVSKDKFWTHVNRTTHKIMLDSVMLRHESAERYLRGRQTLEKYIKSHHLDAMPKSIGASSPKAKSIGTFSPKGFWWA
jgi:hypothetical protein